MVLTLYTGRKSGKYWSENKNEWTVTYSLGGALYNLFLLSAFGRSIYNLCKNPVMATKQFHTSWFCMNAYLQMFIDKRLDLRSSHSPRELGLGDTCDTFVIKSGRGLRIRNLRCLLRRPDHGPGPGWPLIDVRARNHSRHSSWGWHPPPQSSACNYFSKLTFTQCFACCPSCRHVTCKIYFSRQSEQWR